VIDLTVPGGPDLHDGLGDLFIDANGCLAERKMVGDIPVVLHYDDVPESDVATINGLRVATPLRTVIDLAAQMSLEDTADLVDDYVTRGLFTLDDARARLAAEDMRRRPGAIVLRQLLAMTLSE
jgi:hypothetical protein